MVKSHFQEKAVPKAATLPWHARNDEVAKCGGGVM